MPLNSFFKKKAFVGNIGVDGFSLGSDDISQVLAYLDSAQGRDAAIRSPTYFWDMAARFMRPNDNLFGYTMRTYSLISHDVDVYFPPVPSDINRDDLVLAETPAELKNKTITPATNILNGIEKFPDYAKSGKFQGNNFKGEGIMESLIHRDLPELLGDSDEGSYAQYTTSVTSNSNTGFYVANNFMTMPKFDPIFKIKLRVPDWQINTNRLFFGFVSSDFIIINDIPFGLGDAALLMGFRNGDGDFKLFRGVGNGSTSVPPHSTNHATGLNVETLEFGFRNQGTLAYYKIGEDGQEITFSSQLPLPDRWMKVHVDIQNTTSDDRHLDIFWARIESKK